MNDLQIFSNPEFGQVRTVELNGQPWLVGKDVAEALGYKNPGKAIIAHVDEDDKRLEMLSQGTDSQNGNVSPSSKTALINESGLYSLILSSKMPKAKAQAELDSRIDQLQIIAFGLPAFDQIMADIFTTEKKE